MAWLFGDTFDHYAFADIFTKWTQGVNVEATPSLNATGGRRGTASFKVVPASLRAGYMLRKTLPVSGSGFVVGFAFKLSAVGGGTGTGGPNLCSIMSSATWQVTLRLNNNYTLAVYRGAASNAGGTLLATSGVTGLAVNAYNYIEMKGTIHASTGTISVAVNGAPLAGLTGLTGLNTSATGAAAWDVLGLGNEIYDLAYSSGIQALEWDDLYCLDQSGSAPYNTFLGDVRGDWHPVTGVGTTNTFTPTPAVPNWQNVDDTTPDGDTTRNTATAVGNKDTFALTDLVAAGSQILCVQHLMQVKKTSAGACQIVPVIRHSGTDNDGTAGAPSTQYGYQLTPYVTNPGTGVAWTESGFNAIELGYKQSA